MSTRSEQDRAQGRLILEGWDGYVDDEPELGIRLMLLLLYGLFHLSDKQRGWTLETKIARHLSTRVDYDPAAEDALYVLDRCSGGLHPPDACLGRIREAVQHFGPKKGHNVLRRPVEYYRCLVNLGAKLIENALYDEAYEVSRKAMRLIGEYDAGVFPRPEFAHANQLQADYRLGRLTAPAAARRQSEIAREYAVDNDPFYAENALGVYLALAERHADALEIFDRLDAVLLQSRTDPEPSMVYLIRANGCAVRYVAGDLARSQAEWLALTPTAAASNYTDRDILLSRHELLAEVIAAGEPMTAAQFDEHLLVYHRERYGPLWMNFGHGFVLPALELWREN